MYPSPVPTRDDFRAKLLEAADFADQQAERLRAEAEEWAMRAAVIRSQLGEVEESLTSPDRRNTLNAMNATQIDSNALRSRAAVKYKDSAFVAAMAARGETIPDVAAWLTKRLRRPFHRNTLQGWYKPVSEPAHRDIPLDAAEALQDHYGKDKRGKYLVPVESWPRVRR